MGKNVKALPFVKSRFVDLIEEKFKAEEYQESLQKIVEFEQLYSITLDLALLKSICLFEYGQEMEANATLTKFFGETDERSDFALQSFDRMLVYYEGVEDFAAWFEGMFSEEEEVLEVIHHYISDQDKYSFEIDEFSNDLQLDEKRKVEFQKLFNGEGSPRMQLEWISIQTEQPTNELLEEMKQFLGNHEGNPICKTALIAFLREQKVNEEIRVEKFGRVVTLNSSDVSPFLHTQSFVKEAEVKVERAFMKDPVVLQFAMEIVKKYGMVFDPFCDDSLDVFVKALRIYIHELFYGTEGDALQDSQIASVLEKILWSEEAFKELL